MMRAACRFAASYCSSRFARAILSIWVLRYGSTAAGRRLPAPRQIYGARRVFHHHMLTNPVLSMIHTCRRVQRLVFTTSTDQNGVHVIRESRGAPGCRMLSREENETTKTE